MPPDKERPDKVLLGKHGTIHQLRHLHAALMLHGGMPIYDLSRRMGHTSMQITIDLYSHLLPDAHFTAQVAARALEGLQVGRLKIERSPDRHGRL